MKTSKYFLFVLFFALISITCQAQKIVAKPFDFFYQLYTNEIFDVYQDKEGYIWLGTSNGITRYDGTQLHTIKNDYASPARISENTIQYTTDNSKFIWVGTTSGLTLIDKKTYKMKVLENPVLKGKRIIDVKTDKHDCVWLAVDDHLVCSSPDATKFRIYEMPKPKNSNLSFHQLYIDSHNVVWGLSNCGLYAFNRKKDRFDKMRKVGRSDSPYTMYEDCDGIYWIGTWGDGLWKYDKSNETIERQTIRVSGTQREDSIFYSIIQDDVYRYLWVLSYSELHVLKHEKGQLSPIDISQFIDPNMMFTKTMKDKNGNLWLSSYDMGYNIIFDKSGIVNHALPMLKKQLGWDANILNLAVDDGGVLWLEQDRYGMLLYNPTSKEMADCHLPFGEINVLKKSGKYGGMWMNSRSSSNIWRVVREGMQLKEVKRLCLTQYVDNPGGVWDFEEDTEGNLWILTSKNLFVYNSVSQKLSMMDGDFPKLSTIAKDTEGNVWGCTGSRFYKMNCKGRTTQYQFWTTIDSIYKDDYIRMMHVDNRGSVWSVTSYGRLLLLAKGDKNAKVVHLEKFMDDGAVLGITSDEQHLWICTNKKVLKCSLNGVLEGIFNANSDRISVKAFRYKSFCTDDSGGIYVGGHNGVTYIPNRQGYDAATRFEPVVTDVVVNGKSILFDCPGDMNDVRSIIFIPSDIHNLRILFSTLQYFTSDEIELNYRLDGVDKEWIKTYNGRNVASYNSLPKGEYKFHIRHRLSDGTWGESVCAMTIVRLPAWYETTWAYLIYISIAVLMCWILHRKWHAIKHFYDRIVAFRMMMLGKMHISSVSVSKPDDDDNKSDFYSEIVECIEKHLDDDSFDIEKMAIYMATSKSTIHRRIKSHIGITPLELIKRIRLKKACELLEKKDKSISEIGYSVGFSSPKYFTRCFKDEFGMTPTEYQLAHGIK